MFRWLTSPTSTGAAAPTAAAATAPTTTRAATTVSAPATTMERCLCSSLRISNNKLACPALASPNSLAYCLKIRPGADHYSRAYERPGESK
jgi:hypothetical protein